jgi:hypothetical protein
MPRSGGVFGPFIAATLAAIPCALAANTLQPEAWRAPLWRGVELAQSSQSPGFKPPDLPLPKLKPGEFQGLKPDLPRLTPDTLQRQPFKAKDNVFDAKKASKGTSPDTLPDIAATKKKIKEEAPAEVITPRTSTVPPMEPGHDVYDLVKAPRGVNDSRPDDLRQSSSSRSGSVSAKGAGGAEADTSSKAGTEATKGAAQSQPESVQRSSSQKRSATAEGASCKSCRTSCSKRFRNDCEGASCKNKYSACMRGCWDKHCEG